MQTKLKGLLEKIKGFFKKLNKKTLIILAVCATVILALIIWAALMLNRKEYALLYTGLNASETTTVVQYLNEHQVDYQVSGDKILVPKGREMQIQADLAQGGYFTTGFNYDFYTQYINSFSTNAERIEAIRIATVQKLEATIRLMEGVRDAQVDIQPGTERVYMLDDNVSAGTAWVLLTPDGNREISSGVIQAIRNLVLHGEKSLNIESVTIEDIYGNPYGENSDIDTMNDASALRAAIEQETERKVRRNVLQALESVYGAGRVNVAVNTVVDVNRKRIESTNYTQPEGSTENGGLIGTEKWWWEYGPYDTNPVGGVVGTGTNSDIPNYPNRVPGTDGNENYSLGQGEQSHVIDQTITQEEQLAGRIVDISVAVTIDQNSPNAGAMTLQQLTSHVAAASGVGSENPESHVSVIIAPFAVEPPDTTPHGILAFLANVPDWVVLAAKIGRASCRERVSPYV